MKNIFITMLVILTVCDTYCQQTNRILIFSETKGFRHTSIESGRKAIAQLCVENKYSIDSTEDPAKFTNEILKNYDAIIFLNTTGDLFNEPQQEALQDYIHLGGGWVGIHAATDAEYDWPWYGKLAGAYFKSHPAQQEAVVKVFNGENSAMNMLPKEWKRFDEWYNYKSVSNNIKVLAYLDETSYKGGEMSNDHPIVWFQEFEGGKSFYTGFGHTNETFTDPLFLKHLAGGIKMAARKK
jgi:type 1 glutamine amidotransferase